MLLYATGLEKNSFKTIVSVAFGKDIFLFPKLLIKGYTTFKKLGVVDVSQCVDSCKVVPLFCKALYIITRCLPRRICLFLQEPKL